MANVWRTGLIYIRPPPVCNRSKATKGRIDTRRAPIDAPRTNRRAGAHESTRRRARIDALARTNRRASAHESTRRPLTRCKHSSRTVSTAASALKKCRRPAHRHESRWRPVRSMHRVKRIPERHGSHVRIFAGDQGRAVSVARPACRGLVCGCYARLCEWVRHAYFRGRPRALFQPRCACGDHLQRDHAARAVSAKFILLRDGRT